MSDEKHLWEFDHPYYCSEGNFFKNGCHHMFESWAEFAIPGHLSPTGNEGNLLYDFDDDLNMLWRWDWKRAQRGDYVFDDNPTAEELAEWEEASKTDTLLLFFMLQRKAYNISAEVIVTEADEPAVREWLAKHRAKIEVSDLASYKPGAQSG